MSGGRKLASYVSVVGEDGNAVLLAPGTRVPEWAREQITNPKAFGDIADDAEGESTSTTTGTPSAADDQTGAVPEPDPEADKAYADREYRSLQTAAKNRGLSAAGDTPTLIARLEADDREKAALGTNQ